MSDVVRARCLCGAVRLEAVLPTLWVAHCHCESCRLAHGAGVVTYAGFPRGGVRVTAGQAALRRYDSDTGATWTFCGTCGSQLVYESPRWPDETHLSVASLEDPLDRAPQGHAYADRAPAWCPITDDLPR